MTPFVRDTTGPHPARCDRVEVLLEAAGGREHYVTSGVAEEAARLGHPVDTSHFLVAELDTIEALVSLATWQARLGSEPTAGHHLGEAEVAAVSETRDMTAAIDDRKARAVARKFGLDVHGVLWAFPAPRSKVAFRRRPLTAGRRPRLRSMKRSGSPSGCDADDVLQIWLGDSVVLRQLTQRLARPEPGEDIVHTRRSPWPRGVEAAGVSGQNPSSANVTHLR